MSTQRSNDILSTFPIAQIRQDFPILQQDIHNTPLVYLDNAASTQRPKAVIDAICDYYRQDHANVHRGVHTLSQRATDAFEGCRDRLQQFIGAQHREEVILTSGATESLNMIARSFGGQHLQPGDEIVLTQLEHHANIVPWYMIAEQTGAKVRFIPYSTETHTLDISELDTIITDKTRIVSAAHVSNVLGIENPIEALSKRAREVDAIFVLDGAQSIPHTAIDVQRLDCDFFVGSAHKMCGPTGIGFVYGRRTLLDKMLPWLGGGEMIEHVDLEGFTTNVLPHKLEAGTPPIAQGVGLHAAIDYLDAIGMGTIHAYTQALTHRALTQMKTIEGIELHCRETLPVNAVSFGIQGIHPFDIGQMLDQEGIAIRTGTHCAQPLMQCLGQAGTARASFYFYNTPDEVDRFVDALRHIQELLS
ncbi:MAG TPA: cysteine desulfurase CsdA [Myxococcales bacterium]|nr:cysteine desulfurase CsdA [Deltaproteobacteria bacterium]HAA57657.1 cysteine desulfurase CsdA [Myxococcales bacterium]|tara:strand:+ start:8715 stop:9968 length:1254 start_codon:yes stop_codon:yes gene_type:complete